MQFEAGNDLTSYRDNAWTEFWPLSPSDTNGTGYRDYLIADYFPAYTELFDFKVEHYLNYRNSSYVFRRYPSIIWTSVALYLTMVFFGPRFMKNRKAFSLKRSLTVWNLLLAVFSFLGTLRVLPHLLYGHWTNPPTYFVCRNVGGHSIEDAAYFWGTLFLWSKIAEFVDTAFLVLRKKPIMFLHWFHHLTVSLYCWYSWAYQSNTSIYFCAMNYVVHSVMYFYYFLACIGKAPSWGLLVTIIQVAQMFYGIFINVFQYYASTQTPNCDVSWPMLLAATVMYAIYLVLFLQFFAGKYIFRKPRQPREQRSAAVAQNVTKLVDSTNATDITPSDATKDTEYLLARKNSRNGDL